MEVSNFSHELLVFSRTAQIILAERWIPQILPPCGLLFYPKQPFWAILDMLLNNLE